MIIPQQISVLSVWIVSLGQVIKYPSKFIEEDAMEMVLNVGFVISEHSLESLNIHLNTCESYECYRCNLRVYNLSDMKEHIHKKHGAKEYLYIKHGKLDRKNADYVKETSYDRDELQ